MKLKILAAGLLISFLLTFSTGCEIFCPKCPTPPGDGGQPGQVLFFDDFEDGADPAWAPASGTWIVTEDHRYTIEEWQWEGVAYTYVSEGLFWRDYAVEVDVYDANEALGDPGGIIYTPQLSGVVIRAQDDLNKVILVNRADEYLCWYVKKNGDVVKDCVDKVEPGLPEKAHIRIEVIGNTYEAYVNGIRRTVFQLEDSTFERGMPGLYIWYNLGVTFDNFKVTSLGQ